MPQDEVPVLNPNTADDVELRRLPGVGPQLAIRIIESRPYQSAEDLRRVPGLGGRVLDNLRPFLRFEAEGSKDADERTASEKDRAEPEPAEGHQMPDPMVANERKYPIVLTEPRSVGTGLWALLAVGAASVLCSVTLTLSVLAGINSTLDFGRHAAVQDTRNELIQVRSQLAAIQVEVEALRGRAEALEGMSGRMVEVEGQVEALQRQIGETVASVDDMQMVLTVALEETRAQAERVNRFQTFLDGLGQLIGQVVSEP